MLYAAAALYCLLDITCYCPAAAKMGLGSSVALNLLEVHGA